MNVIKRVAKGTFWSFLAQIISYSTGFIMSVFFARWLEPENYGLIPLTMTIVTVFGIFSDFGVNASSSKYISEYRAKDIGLIKSIIKDGFILKLIFSFTVSIICFFFSKIIAEFMHMMRLQLLLQISSVMIFFISFLGFFNAIFQGFQRLKFTTLTSFSQNVIKLIISLGFVYLGYGIIGAIIGYTISFIITALLTLIIIFLKFYNTLPVSNSNKSIRKEILKYSIPLVIVSASNFIYMSSDFLMLGYFTTSSEVGFYNIARKIIELILLPCMALQISLTPMIANLYAKGDIESNESAGRLFIYSIKYSLLLMIPATFGLIILAKPLILFLFGEEYIATATLLSLLSLYLLPRSILGGSPYMIAAGKASTVSKLTTITAILNIILNLFLIPKYHAIGAVISTLITHPLYIFFITYLAKKTYRIQFSQDFKVSIIKFVFAAGIMSYVIAYFKYLATSFIGIISIIMLAAFIYFIILFIIKGISGEDIKKIKSIIHG